MKPLWPRVSMIPGIHNPIVAAVARPRSSRSGERSYYRETTIHALVVALCCCWSVMLTAQERAAGAEFVKPPDGKSALCVVLGCQDGRLPIALSGGGRHVVHGLCLDDAHVARAREAIQDADLLGLVSVERGPMKKLPYADNLVNLLVAGDLPELLKQGLPLSEVVRALQPRGVAWLGGVKPEELKQSLSKLGVEDVQVQKEGETTWVRFTKPRPKDLDTWTHRRRDASFNPVSHDKLAGVPSGVRWAAGPNWPTGGRKSAVHAVAATEKRLVYVFEDEVDSFSGLKRENSLICRDAFNGLKQWRRRSESDQLVAVGDAVYTIVGGKLVALDADSGRVTREFDKLKSPETFSHVDGRLLVTHDNGLSCLDAATGELNWRHDDEPSKVLAGDGRVFLQRGGRVAHVDCLELKTGKPVWSAPIKLASRSSPSLILYYEGILLGASRSGNYALSAKDGAKLWEYSYSLIGHGGSFSKVMATGGLVWVHTSNSGGSKQYAWEGLDPRTGRVKQRVLQPREFRMKHRCSYDVATGRYFMCGSMDIADLQTGEYHHFTAARNSCRAAGVVPANGLVYTFPHACGCYAMLRGFLGLECADPATKSSDTPPLGERLVKGPADGNVAKPESSAADWPTYRFDTLRSGGTKAAGPGKLAMLWADKVAPAAPQAVSNEWDLKTGPRVSSPVVAGGLALVAACDQHQVMALDAATGKTKWSFLAGARVDCPPTVHHGLCLFGARDGWVYCLRASDGQLVWRYRAAPQVRRIVAYGQLESPWPVVGGVLVYDNLAYALVGRHSGSDGGLRVHAIDPATGKLVWDKLVENHDGVGDVLTGADGTIQMASWTVDAKTGKKAGSSDPRLRGGRLGLLSNAWYKRPIAMRKNLQRWAAGDRPGAQIISFNQRTTAGYVAAGRVSGGDGKMSGTALLFNKAEKGGKDWAVKMPLAARLYGMAIAGERLYVAGLLYDDEKDKQGETCVRAYALADGKEIGEFILPARPVHDGLAVAHGRVYVSTHDGKLFCLGEK